MFPSADHIATFQEYLSKGLQFAHDTEVELRFSTFSRNGLYQQGHPADPNRKPQTYRFVPIIDPSVFHQTLATFRTYGLPEHRFAVTDVLYNDVRQSIDCDGNSTWLTKTRGRYTDFHDYNMRASWATEIPRAPLDLEANRPDLVRMKDRTSFTDGCARYDFTIVQSQDLRSSTQKPARTSYEIEIEFIPPSKFGNKNNLKHLDYAVQHLIFCTRHMLLTLQSGSADIVSLSTKHNVLLEYCTLTGVRHFLGAQPETLHRHHVNRIRTGYCMAEKYDGERFLFFVSDNGWSYLIDRSMQVKVAPQVLSQQEKGTILDVEVYAGDIYAFDIVFHRGRDLRDCTDMTLTPRLKVLNKAVTTLRREHDDFHQNERHQHQSGQYEENRPSRLHVKPHYFVHEFPKVFDRWNLDAYDDGIARDGFIFTPIAEPYPNKTKWSTLLKWKPADMNSIDFLLGDVTETTDGELSFQLLVGDKDNRNTVFELCPTIHIERDDPLRSTLHPGTILECTYDNKDSMIPWRPRPDKLKPNYRYVAVDVWKSMHEPVHIQDLEQSPFQNLRQFHNCVKDDLINKAVAAVPPITTKGLSCLDLACGRGGDLHKWRKASISNYIGVDISGELMQEALSRAAEIKRKHPTFHTRFIKADLRSDTLIELPENNAVDVVSCQFAFHYFYESEEAFANFIGIVTRTIKNGGIFITSLFDGYRVFDLCAKGDNEQMINGVGFRILPQFDVRMGIANIKRKEFGIPVAVAISGDDDVILKSSTVEYVVFPDLFLLRMKALGFELCETKLFLDVKPCLDKEGRYHLSDLESAYSDLHRYYMFRKVSEESININSDWITLDALDVSALDAPTETALFKDDAESPERPTLYIRSRPSTLQQKEDPSWLTSYLDLITGRTTLNFRTRDDDDAGAGTNGEERDYQLLVEHYNVFLSIVYATTADVNGPLHIDRVATYKPTVYLEDVKRIYFLKVGHIHQIVSRNCNNSRKKLLWFPSLIDGDNAYGGSDPGIASEPSAVVPVAVPIPVPIPVIVSSSTDFSFNDKFTIRELQAYAATQDIKIPSSLRKKSDMVSFLQKELSGLVL